MTEESPNSIGSGNPARKPDYVAYSVRPRNNQKAKWTEIGVAFKHKDGIGLDLLLDATPVSGKIVLRMPEANG